MGKLSASTVNVRLSAARKLVEEARRAVKNGSGGEVTYQIAVLQAEVDRLTPVAERAVESAGALRALQQKHDELVAAMRVLVERAVSTGSPVVGSSDAPIMIAAPIKPSARREKPAVPTTRSHGLSMSEQKILDALASLEAVGVQMPTKTQLAAFAGYSNPKSGGFAAPAAALVRKGLMESSAGKASMTSTGRDSADRPSVPATTKELQERIGALLGEGERKLLTILIASHPESINRAELATQGGYSNQSRADSLRRSRG